MYQVTPLYPQMSEREDTCETFGHMPKGTVINVS